MGSWMVRNSESAMGLLKLPTDRVIELGGPSGDLDQKQAGTR
jgi:hypothetical protein